VPTLSIKLTQQKLKWNNQFSYRYSYKGLSVQPGLIVRNLTIQNLYNLSTIPALKRNYNLIAPTLYVYYKGVGLSYSRTLTEPSASALRPIVDSSNPLYINSGNPNLRPSKTDVYSLNFYKYFNRSKVNLNTWASVNKRMDAVGTSRQIFPDGKTVLGYLNLNDITSYNASFNISKSYYKKDWNYSVFFNSNLYLTQSPVVLNLKVINTVSTNSSPGIGGFIAYKNKYRWQTAYRVDFNSSKSDDSTVRKVSTTQHSFTNSFHVQIMKKLYWDANANYNFNPSIPTGFQKSWLFCDMYVAYSFLKKERAQLKLSAYDIFNQNQGIYRSAYQNYITINQSLVQKRYFMLTLIYTLQKI
jgi:hypothetical protein